MIALHLVAACALASFLLAVVPGPSVLFVISRGVALGRKAALLTVLGNSSGFVLQVVVVAAGLGSVLARSVVLLHVVRLVGAAYIVHLGVQAVRHRTDLREAVQQRVEATSSRRVLREGFIVGITNPKGVVFFSAVLPQFVDPNGGPVPLQLLVLGLVFVVIASASDCCWALLAGTARSWLSRSPRRLSALGGAGGITMIGLGVRLALTGQRH